MTHVRRLAIGLGTIALACAIGLPVGVVIVLAGNLVGKAIEGVFGPGSWGPIVVALVSLLPFAYLLGTGHER